MKKIVVASMLLVLCACFGFSQSKKELLAEIEKLEETNAELLDKLNDANKLLSKEDFTILELQKENEKLNEELAKLKKLLEISKSIDNEITKGNLISDSTERGHKVIRRVYVDSIKTKYLWNDSLSDVYDDYIDGRKIGSFTPGDTINLSEIIFVDSKKTWLKIATDSLSGYVHLSEYNGSDWFENGEHSYLKTIYAEDDVFIVRYYNQKVSLELDAPIEYRENPGKSGKIIGTFKYINKFTPTPVLITAYTTDSQWIFVQNDEGSGWVPCSYVELGRGGPVVFSPDYYLLTDFVDQP